MCALIVSEELSNHSVNYDSNGSFYIMTIRHKKTRGKEYERSVEKTSMEIQMSGAALLPNRIVSNEPVPYNMQEALFASPHGTMTNMEVAATVVNDSCALCGLGPPPNLILHIPPPPIPTFLQYGSNVYSHAGVLINLAYLNNSLCKHSCNWRTEGVQYVEMPHQGTVFDDTWLLVLISSCVGVLIIGLILAALALKYKFHGSVKNGSMSIAPPASCTESKSGRMQNEAILYPCAVDNQDSRVMWATLTPRGTMRHYLEEHTYETIANGSSHKHIFSAAPTEHAYAQPSIPQPAHAIPKDEKAFDNTAFIDYEEPLSLNSESYQLSNNMEVAESDHYGTQKSAIRPRVSSPTRIEHPNLPPLNLYPKKYGSCKGGGNYQQSSDTFLKVNNTLTTKFPLSNETHKAITF